MQKVLDAFWAQKDDAGKHLTEILVHQVCENNIETIGSQHYEVVVL